MGGRRIRWADSEVVHPPIAARVVGGVVAQVAGCGPAAEGGVVHHRHRLEVGEEPQVEKEHGARHRSMADGAPLLRADLPALKAGATDALAGRHLLRIVAEDEEAATALSASVPHDLIYITFIQYKYQILLCVLPSPLMISTGIPNLFLSLNLAYMVLYDLTGGLS